jgi:hypothetical protein
MFTFLKEKQFSFCFLQELHCKVGDDNKWDKEWKGDLFLSGNSSNSKGVGILIQEGFQYKLIEYKEIIEGRLQMLKLEIQGNAYVLINLYGPNDDDVEFFNILDEIVISHNDQTLIVGGDFNTVLNFQIDKLNGRKNTNIKCSQKLNTLIENNDLHDIWRLNFPNKMKFTWHSNTKPTIFCRLDYFLISSNLINNSKKCYISTGYCSDHSPVVFELNTSKLERGPGYFKMNNSFLLNNEYQQNIRKSITEIVELNKEANPMILWEIIKGRIRDETIKFSVKFKKSQNNEQLIFEQNINKLEQSILTDPNNNVLLHNLKTEKENLQKILDEKIKGILIRSKAEWVEGAERCSKYFANLEKKNGEAKTINSLTTESGIDIHGTKNILSYIKSFYEHIYTKDEFINDNDYFFPNNHSTLSNEEKQSCDGKLNEKECIDALKEMKNGKSPGSDGISVEFYKIFWHDIKQYMINSLNYSHENGFLSELQKQSFITLIPKKDKTLTDINNWRPISLLNIDYKISAKAIANRIKRVLEKLISTDQTGFIKGRYIGENIRIINEVINKVNDDNEEGLIFFADYKKAFDSLDHNFMFKCLRYFNFGESLVQWIQLFYRDAKGSIINNGHMSDFFGVKRGVRQGCPLSPYLFILCVELLSHSIENNPNIIGITIKNIHFKQTLFADDASFFVNGTRNSFENLIDTIDKFSLVSGLCLNESKCTVFKLGSMRSVNLAYSPNKKFNWNSETASTLGIIFTNDIKKLIELNFKPKIEAFSHTLKFWKKWKLSLYGKITVLKTFAWPKLIYPLTVLNNPPLNMINDIKNMMFQFLWDHKPDKISRNTIIQNYEDGGLKMIDIESSLNSLKVSWVKRLLYGKDAKWKHLYLNELTKHGGMLIFKCNIESKDVKALNIKLNFLENIIYAWSTVNFDSTQINISEEILWNNSRIKIGNQMFFYNQWFRKGIINIGHIFDFDTKTMFTFDKLKTKFDLNAGDFLNYYKIKNSIQKYWKSELINQQRPRQNIDYLINRITANTKVTRLIYNIQILKKRKPIETKLVKWQNEFDNVTLNWKQIFIIPLKCTIDTKLREYQYKYLWKIVPSNTFLYKCKLTESTICDFCSMSTETVKHLFWECQYVQRFWMDLTSFLQTKNIHVRIDYKLITFGITKDIDNYNTSVLNFIILLSKYFISKNKYNNTRPTIEQFITYLDRRIKVEQYIASFRDKIHVFYAKWNNFIDLNT